MQMLGERMRARFVNAPPEWRWLRAVSIRDSRKRTRTAESDIHVQHAISFLSAMDKCHSEDDWDELNEDMPDECDAYSCWIDPDRFQRRFDIKQTEIRRQSSIEAYLLTQADYDIISNRTGLSVPALKLYENWYFDFRSRMHLPHWIGTQGFRGDVAGMHGIEFDHLVRLFGFNYGLEAVDDLLRGTNYSLSTCKALRKETADHLMKASAIVGGRTYMNPGSLLEAARGQLEVDDRRHQFDVQVGAEFQNKAAEDYHVTTEESVGGYKWATIDLPVDVEAMIPRQEKRLAVQLGYEPDLSVPLQVVPSSD